jgi:hypothetical protein
MKDLYMICKRKEKTIEQKEETECGRVKEMAIGNYF